MFEFPIGFIQFSPLEIFLHCHIGEGHEYLEFLAYFPELKKIKSSSHLLSTAKT